MSKLKAYGHHKAGVRCARNVRNRFTQGYYDSSFDTPVQRHQQALERLREAANNHGTDSR